MGGGRHRADQEALSPTCYTTRLRPLSKPPSPAWTKKPLNPGVYTGDLSPCRKRAVKSSAKPSQPSHAPQKPPQRSRKGLEENQHCNMVTGWKLGGGAGSLTLCVFQNFHVKRSVAEAMNKRDLTHRPTNSQSAPTRAAQGSGVIPQRDRPLAWSPGQGAGLGHLR